MTHFMVSHSIFLLCRTLACPTCATNAMRPTLSSWWLKQIGDFIGTIVSETEIGWKKWMILPSAFCWVTISRSTIGRRLRQLLQCTRKKKRRRLWRLLGRSELRRRSLGSKEQRRAVLRGLGHLDPCGLAAQPPKLSRQAALSLIHPASTAGPKLRGPRPRRPK